MKHPVSILLMDVTGSNQMNGGELTEYLGDTVQRIQRWTNGIVETRAVSRMGDEILLISEHFSTAYILASYLSRFWKHRDHPPYFGLAAGFLEQGIEEIPNIDQFNHPLVKQARVCLDEIKNQPNRTWLRLHIDGEHRAVHQLLNQYLVTYQSDVDQQTDVQRTVCSLYAALGKQKEVARHLGKTPATVSAQIKQGRCEMLLMNDFMLGEHLAHMEAVRQSSGEESQLEENEVELARINAELRESIKRQITAELPALLKGWQS